MATKRSCGTCDFWHCDYDAPVPDTPGQCRWRPPAFNGPGSYAQFPTTKASDWCGQYKAASPRPN